MSETCDDRRPRLFVISADEQVANHLRAVLWSAPATEHADAEPQFEIMWFATGEAERPDLIAALTTSPRCDVAIIAVANVMCDADLITVRMLRDLDEHLPLILDLTTAPSLASYVSKQLKDVPNWLLRTSPWNDDELVQTIRSLAEQRLRCETPPSEARATRLCETNDQNVQAQRVRRHQKLEALGMFAGGIAHEFNNMLQAIQGYAHFALNEVAENTTARDDLQQVLNVSRRAAAITGQLLEFSCRRPLHIVTVQLNEVVLRTLEQFPPPLLEGISVDLDLAESARLIAGDCDLLEVVVTNLCHNSCDAMGMGGRLRLSTQNLKIELPSDRHSLSDLDLPEGAYVMLTVEDSGCGMTPHVQDRLFEPFFSTKEVGSGTGMGLATIHGIVTQHHGAIDFDSRPGVGTKFRVLLPAAVSDPRSLGSDMPVPEESVLVLVAEDDPVVREVAVRILNKGGFKTLSAADGEEALELFHQYRNAISVVLLDVVMPKQSGREVCEQIHALAPDVEVIFCTGYDPHLESLSLPAGDGIAYVGKPYRSKSLLDAVQAGVAARHRREMLAGHHGQGN